MGSSRCWVQHSQLSIVHFHLQLLLPFPASRLVVDMGRWCWNPFHLLFPLFQIPSAVDPLFHVHHSLSADFVPYPYLSCSPSHFPWQEPDHGFLPFEALSNGQSCIFCQVLLVSLPVGWTPCFQARIRGKVELQLSFP